MSSDDDDLDTYTQPFRAYNLARPTAKPPAVILSDSSNDDDLDNLPSQKPAVKAPSRTRRIVPGPRDSPPPRPPPSRRTKASAESVTSDTDGGSESDDPVPIKLRTKSRGEGRGEKIIMTEDEEEEDVYQAYKRKMDEDAKRRKRGKAGASTATDGAPNKRRKVGDVGATKAVAVKEKRKPGKQDVAGRDNIVGRRAPPNTGRQRQYNFGGDDMSEELMELPSYIKERWKAIEKARTSPNPQYAIKLPPTYEDVVFSDDERFAELAERPGFAHVTPPGKYKDIPLTTSGGVIPAPIAQWLRDYQVQGAQFLHETFVYHRGGILGDDMGLGKTVQVIAFLAAAFGKTGDERDMKRMRKMRRLGNVDSVWYPRVLVVCPATLMGNWKSELDTWGWWSYETFHGSKDNKDNAIRAAQNGHCEIMITTYTTYKNSRDLINQIPWDCVIADECHMIKERKSDITKAMNDVNALCRIGLTGTAIQNKYEELWTLLNWCNPNSVGSLGTWNRTISRPLKFGQAHDATSRQLGIARRIAHQLVTNLLPRMFLRRMKSLIAAQLPKKSDRVVFCPLTRTQTEAYENLCESEIVTLIKYSGDKCDCGSTKKRGTCCYKKTEDGKHWKEMMFPCIQNVQKLCNHIANWIPLNEEPADKREGKMEWLQTCLPNDWERIFRRTPMENYMDPELCGKWIVLQKLLTFWHTNNDKVLIFSHSIRLLDILRHLFTNTSYNVSYLDGKMSLDDRSSSVHTFNTSESSFIFLISTRAGGVGLNITRANKVVIFDPGWNPSHDLQAQDRAYRIGQHRDVEVFRLVAAGTIEEIVYARQIYKQQQANIGYGATAERRYFKGVMGEEGRKGELFGLKNMFTFHGDGVVVAGVRGASKEGGDERPPAGAGGIGGFFVKSVVNQTNVAEERMGVRVIGLEGSLDDVNGNNGDELSPFSDDDEDEDWEASDPDATGGEDSDIDLDTDDPLSQLPTLAKKSKSKSQPKKATGKKRKRPRPTPAHLNPIHTLLSAAGVSYTHENSDLLGSSAIESKLSAQAFTNSSLLPPPTTTKKSAAEKAKEKVYDSGDGYDDGNKVTVGGKTYCFRPPVDVMRRQFCEMSRGLGFRDVLEFALVVEGWGAAERRRALEKFYRGRRRRSFVVEEEGGGVGGEADGLDGEATEGEGTEGERTDGEEVEDSKGEPEVVVLE